MPILPAPAHPTTSARYHRMAEIVVPVAYEPDRFLVGEAVSHRPCEISGEVEPTYRGFFARRALNGTAEFYELDNPVTVPEWNALPWPPTEAGQQAARA